MWLWVDVFGMVFIKQRDLTVRVAVPYQWIASWAIDNDLFKVQLVNRNGKAKMHTFATGYTRAVQLKDGLWNFVNLYLKHPKAVKTLAKMSAPLEEGALLEAGLFASVPPLDATDFSHPEELSSKTQRSLTKGTPRNPRHAVLAGLPRGGLGAGHGGPGHPRGAGPVQPGAERPAGAGGRPHVQA